MVKLVKDFNLGNNNMFKQILGYNNEQDSREGDCK